MLISRRRFAEASLAAALASCGRDADLVLHGGAIYTGVAANPRVEALRLSAGRIVFAGALDSARGAGARLIDLGDAVAFPGFIDSHVHLTGVGMAAMVLDLVGTPSVAALQASLREYAASHPEGPIYGRGWIETHWPEQRFPNRADLDAVVPNRPVILERIDGHAAVANSAALALAEISPNTPDPDGGRIERDASGAATGILIDNAAGLVQSRFPPPTPEQRWEALKQAARLYASRGWTGVANMSTSAEEVLFFERLAAAGELPLKADLYVDPASREAVFSSRTRAASQRVRVRGLKLYMDGALGSRGAALLAPYSDAPGNGLIVTPLEEIRAQLEWARRERLQVALHAIGDRGNRMALDAYRDAFADHGAALRSARWRIEHAQILDPTDIPRFASMGVIASMQPSHAISDLYFAPSRLGNARLVGAYAWQSLLRTGAALAAGSDAPVERGDPLVEFYAAAHRHSLDGFADANWRLEERMSREQALAALTSGGAYATFSEAERGTLEVGKRADISVFSADLMQALPEQILQARAVLTICDGQITHEAL